MTYEKSAQKIKNVNSENFRKINVLLPQSESTPRRLTLGGSNLDERNRQLSQSETTPLSVGKIHTAFLFKSNLEYHKFPTVTSVKSPAVSWKFTFSFNSSSSSAVWRGHDFGASVGERQIPPKHSPASAESAATAANTAAFSNSFKEKYWPFWLFLK